MSRKRASGQNSTIPQQNDSEEQGTVPKKNKWGIDEDGAIATTSVDCLIDDVLVLIFQQLSFRDRIKIEGVCRRWQYVAAQKSWTSFKHFSIANLTHICKQLKNKAAALKKFRKNYFPFGQHIGFLTAFQFKCLFDRCAPYIQELSFECLYLEYPNLWSKFVDCDEECKTTSNRILFSKTPNTKPKFVFPNLRHLNLQGMQLATNDLKNIAKAFSKLISFEVSELHKKCWTGLTHLLSNCHHLEYLKITEFHNPFHTLKFSALPKQLKYMEMDHTVNIVSLLRTGVTSCSQLKAIELDRSAGLKDNFFAAISAYKDLQYLLLHLSVDNEPYFLEALKSLQSLRALQIYGFRSVDSKIPEAISSLTNLEHLNLAVLAASELDCLLKSVRLKSLSLYLKKSESQAHQSSIYFESFFERLAMQKTLQHFDTNAQLSTKSICTAVDNCKNLRFVSWKTTTANPLDHELLFQHLELRHEGEPKPVAFTDPRMLQVHVKKSACKYTAKSCWVNFCKDMQSSHIMEEIRLGTLYSKPYFASHSYKDHWIEEL